MTSRPAPKRRGESRRARRFRERAASTDLLDARRVRAPRSRGPRLPALPRPAVVGAMALLVAGGSALVVSTSDEREPLGDQYQALSAELSETERPRNASNPVEVTHDFDRDLLAEQSEKQASQRNTALRELAKKTEQHASEQSSNQWVLPVAGYRVTAGFGESSSLWSSDHTGLDFAAPAGTPIVAVTEATVSEVGYAGAYGNRTVLTLDDDTEIWYGHQSGTTVSVGDRVSPGQPIGYVGSTGNSTGPHLHLEIRTGPDSPVDPAPVLASHGVRP